jgi:hypothetical protein
MWNVTKKSLIPSGGIIQRWLDHEDTTFINEVDELLEGGIWLEEVGTWVCAFEGYVLSFASSCWSLCSLAAIKWVAFLYYFLQPWCFSFAMDLKSNEASWAWTETSETMNPNKSFFP